MSSLAQRILGALLSKGACKPYMRNDSIIVHRSRLYGGAAHPDPHAAALVTPSPPGQYRLQLQRADSLTLARRSMAEARRARAGAAAHAQVPSSSTEIEAAPIRRVSWAE